MGISERKERERERRKQEIIEAAEKVFFSQGYSLASMDQVADEAELSKGTLYLYFKNKENLHWAIAERGMSLLREMITERVSETKTGLENLAEIARCFLEFAGKYENYFLSILFFEGKDIGKLDLEPGLIRNAFINESPIVLLRHAVEQGIADGSIRSDLPAQALTHILWAQTLGVLQVIHNKKEIFDLYGIGREDLLTSHLEILKSGIVR